MQSVPIKLLAEAQQHIVTIELTSGDTYRGKLQTNEDNMNLKLTDVVATARSGKVTHMDSVFVRGSHVSMVILPEMLQYSPVLQPPEEPPKPVKRKRND